MQDKEEKSGMVGRRTNGRTDGQEWSSVENAFSGFFSSVSVSRVKPPLFGSLTYIPPHLSAFFNSTNDVRTAFTHLVQVWKKKAFIWYRVSHWWEKSFCVSIIPPSLIWLSKRMQKNCITWEVFFFCLAMKWTPLLKNPCNVMN